MYTVDIQQKGLECPPIENLTLNFSDDDSQSSFSQRNSRSKPDGDDAKSLYEEESILDQISGKRWVQTYNLQNRIIRKNFFLVQKLKRNLGVRTE